MTNYNDDFFAWTQETARAIQAGRFDEIDRTALADEVESMGKSESREAQHRLSVVVEHMLKLKYQPGRKTRSWDLTLREQRLKLESVLLDSPSLRPRLPELLQQAYRASRLKAARQTRLPLDVFPVDCEWSIEDVLNQTGNI